MPEAAHASRDSAMIPLMEPAFPPDPEGGVTAVPAARRVLLRARGLRKSFEGQTVLGGIDLELRQGEVVLLRGENGSGKTTLLDILTGHLEPDAGAILYSADGMPRAYGFPRPWWRRLDPRRRFCPEALARGGIGRTWQDVRLFRAQSVRDNIVVAAPDQPGENPLFALFRQGAVRRAERETARKAHAMLARLGLAGREDSRADKISLGQSRRVAVARAVAAGARVLFLDEPLASLDRAGIADTLALLEALARDHAITLVIVEHAFNHVHLHGLVTAHWRLENGRLQRDEPTRPAAGGPAAAARHDPRPPWLASLGGPAGVAAEDEALPRGGRVTRLRCADVFRHPPVPLLEIRGLTVRRGSRAVVGLDDEGRPAGFDLTLHEGETAVLQAPNGWGKSTLLEAICGVIPVSSGRILLRGVDVTDAAAWTRRRLGISLALSAGGMMPALSVEEYARLAGAASLPAPLAHFGKRRVGDLSGGQKQLLALAVAAGADRPPVRIFDEPFAMLDAATVETAARFLRPDRASAVLLAFPTSSDQ